ncbi:MAG: hypothetical protein ACI8RD_000809 [Bacillariaceae sp.]|jgi:hypothetical protein
MLEGRRYNRQTLPYPFGKGLMGEDISYKVKCTGRARVRFVFFKGGKVKVKVKR